LKTAAPSGADASRPVLPALERLVVRAPNWLGDAVMALPALASVRASLPDARITIAARAGIAPIFRERTIAGADDVMVVPERDREPASLREGRFDAILLLPNSFRSAWTARRAGVPDRWGYRHALRGMLLTHSVPRPGGHLHQAEYYLRLVRALGFPEAPPGGGPAVTVRPDTAQRAAALLEAAGVPRQGTIVGFAPGAAYGHAKRWPPTRVADVIARLSRERGVICVLVGAAGDRPAAREIESSLPAGVPAIDLTGRTDLRTLAGVLARCAAFVSNDSGAMHLAAAVGVPVTAIFGPTDERATAPLGEHDILIHHVFCRPCMLRECPIDHRCMKGITPEAVYQAVARRLELRA
jgi:heptosyltransferase-2